MTATDKKPESVRRPSHRRLHRSLHGRHQSVRGPWMLSIESLPSKHLPVSSLVVGGPDVGSSPSGLFARIATINAKHGPFDIVLVAGDLFSGENEVDRVLSGEFKVVVPTFFTLGKRALPEKVIERVKEKEGEVCDNLVFLGKPWDCLAVSVLFLCEPMIRIDIPEGEVHTDSRRLETRRAL
jgi:hypothetical protein